MTETALNERIAELQENESEAAHQWQKAQPQAAARHQQQKNRQSASDNKLRRLCSASRIYRLGLQRKDAAPYR